MENKTDERLCPFCGKEKSIKNFIVDYREKGKYLFCCKSCTDYIVTQGASKGGLVLGIWSAAMCNNVPMIKEVWEEAANTIVETSPSSPFATYYKILREKYGKYDGVWESDCSGSGNIQTTTNNSGNTPTEETDIKQLVKDWGKFVNVANNKPDYEAYAYLVNRYAEYTNEVQGLTKAMAMQFRNLCKAEWQKIKADESGDINEIAKAQKLLDNLYSQLKLDDFVVEKSDVDRFIDRLIWRIEETEPAEIEDETKYQDVAGHEKTYNSIMRSLRNIVANSRDYPEVPTEEM